MLHISKSSMRTGGSDCYIASDAVHDLFLTVEDGNIVRIVNRVTNRVLSSKSIVAMVNDAFNAYLLEQDRAASSQTNL